MVNVLQSIILTDNEKMLLTPTYWAFDFYKVHQDATMLPLSIACAKYESQGQSIDAISASASRDKDGKIHITLTNIDPNKPQTVSCELLGVKAKNISGKVLTAAKISDHNTFENPKAVVPKDFKDVKLTNENLSLTLPAKSVVTLEIR
jgi:alpha-N-arabinofuranosidase